MKQVHGDSEEGWGHGTGSLSKLLVRSMRAGDRPRERVLVASEEGSGRGKLGPCRRHWWLVEDTCNEEWAHESLPISILPVHLYIGGIEVSPVLVGWQNKNFSLVLIVKSVFETV